MSQWSQQCYQADLASVKKTLRHAKANREIYLDKRESSLRFNALMHVIAGAQGAVDEKRVGLHLYLPEPREATVCEMEQVGTIIEQLNSF